MIEPLLTNCQHAITQHGGIFLTLFVAGAVGSLTHCAGMCGPFVMAQTTERLRHLSVDKMSEWQRLQGAALLPYHFGRLTTYVGLGILVSTMTQGVVVASGFKILNGLLLLIAGALFLTTALRNTKLTQWRPRIRVIELIQSFFSDKAKAFLLRPTGVDGYVAGLLLGFLPCGLLYSALLIVSSANAGIAAAGMAFFGLATIPALFMVSYGTHHMQKRWGTRMETIGRLFMLANGVMLIMLAEQKLI